MKRAFDVVVSATLLVVLMVPMLVLAWLVRSRLGAPVLFRQTRPGLGGRPFQMIKFRTMTDERDQGGCLLSDAQRLTTFGARLRASSLDELPELWNVLVGDMSLVGPRPLLMEYLPKYSSHQARRHEVRPGVTGLAQVSGRNLLSWEDRFDLDVQYVDSQSFALDLKILFKTVGLVISREGVSAHGQATVEPFGGEK